MISSRSFFVGCCCFALPVWGGELLLEVPPETTSIMPLVSLYPNSDPSEPPLATALESGAVDYEGNGPVWIGLSGFPGRLGPFDDGESVRFGEISLVAPSGGVARFGILAGDGGLVGTLYAGTTAVLPAGTYDLRRDLGEETFSIVVSANDVTEVGLGVVRMDWNGRPISPVYFADAETRRVYATALAGEDVALGEGRYLASTGANEPVSEVNVVANEVTETRVLKVRLESLIVQQTRINIGEWAAILTSDETLTLLAQGDNRLFHDELGALEAMAGVPETIWMNTDGSYPRISGLAVAIAEGSSPFIAGGLAEILVELPSGSNVTVILSQGSNRLASQFENMNGQAVLDVSLPQDLTMDPVTLDVTATRLIDGREFSGQVTGIPIHLPPGDLISGVAVADVTATTVSLTWELDLPMPVNIYRNQFPRPLNGQLPVTDSMYQDIGLSAGRVYTYRVCPVDDLGLQGACGTVQTATAQR